MDVTTTATCAVLFPGQGGYYGGALAGLQDEHPEVGAVFGEIDRAARPLLGRTPSDELLRGPVRSLQEWLVYSPELLQLGIYGAAVATYQILRRQGLRTHVLVGHSFGEVAALVAAGAFTVAEGAEIVCHRSAALAAADLPDAHMAALGTDPRTAQTLLGLLGDEDSAVAVENHATQTVVSGRTTTLDSLARLAAVLRISTVRIASPYPFHSPLLARAERDFADRIRHLRPAALQAPVWSPILGRVYTADDDLTGLLASHLVRPVRFAETVTALRRDGVGVFVECGALDTLTRIVVRVLDDRDVVTVATLLPDAGEARSLRDAVARLADAGAVEPAGPSGEDLATLGRLLLPDVDAPTFQRFWASHGAKVAGLVRDEYARARPHAPAAAEPSPAPAVAATGAHSRPDVLRDLVATYAEALEYPAEVFEEDTDLEAELGVDSVKQTELLARVSERYQLPPRPPEFRVAHYNTLGRIADLVVSSPAPDVELAESA